MVHLLNKLRNKVGKLKEARDFFFKYQTVSVYESNPFSSGPNSTKDPVLKITVAGIPLPVQDDKFF